MTRWLAELYPYQIFDLIIQSTNFAPTNATNEPNEKTNAQSNATNFPTAASFLAATTSYSKARHAKSSKGLLSRIH